MNEHPIIFKDEVIRAILAGVKTQSLRLKGLKEINEDPDDWTLKESWSRVIPGKYFTHKNGSRRFVKFPYGAPGDLIWVREALKKTDLGFISFCDSRYVKDHDGVYVKWPWRRDTLPSIHMPRWASRITLVVKSVRFERLQDISEKDAKAEGDLPGCVNNLDDLGACRCGLCTDPLTYQGGFQKLWDSINAKNGMGWDKNPWVSVTEFEVKQ